MRPGDVFAGKFALRFKAGLESAGQTSSCEREVWRAKHLASGEAVTLELYRPELEGQTSLEQLRHFVAATTSTSLSTPYVVPILEVGASGAWFFAVMESLEGETLRQRLDLAVAVACDRSGCRAGGVTSVAELTSTLSAAFHSGFWACRFAPGLRRRSVPNHPIILSPTTCEEDPASDEGSSTTDGKTEVDVTGSGRVWGVPRPWRGLKCGNCLRVDGAGASYCVHVLPDESSGF